MLFDAILDHCHMNNGSYCPHPFPGHQKLHLAWYNKVGTMLMSLSPVKSWFCLLIQTKPVEHRTDSLKLGPCWEQASQMFDTKTKNSVPRKAKQHKG